LGAGTRCAWKIIRHPINGVPHHTCGRRDHRPRVGARRVRYRHPNQRLVRGEQKEPSFNFAEYRRAFAVDAAFLLWKAQENNFSRRVVLHYRNLLAVEQGFLVAKTLLATRPIFHRTDAAIRGHIFCTFLALVLRKELMDRLIARRQALPEWQQVVDDLADLSEIEVEQDGRRALLRTAPGPFIDPLCRAVGVTLPPVFQELPHT
jgi:hypothetical protein